MTLATGQQAIPSPRPVNPGLSVVVPLLCVCALVYWDGWFAVTTKHLNGALSLAAVSVAAVRYAVRSYAFLDASPGVVMTLVNELLGRDEPEGRALLTAIYAVVDSTQGNFTYASGGHEPPLLRRVDGTVEELPQGGRAMGVYGEYTYTESSLQMKPGETLVMVTDGIIEARVGSNLFGIERIKQYLAAHQEQKLSEIADGLLNAATKHAGGALQDDVAIVVLEIGTPQSA